MVRKTRERLISIVAKKSNWIGASNFRAHPKIKRNLAWGVDFCSQVDHLWFCALLVAHHNIYRIDWKFIPSTSLGGDAFGYYWLDEDHFVISLIDVSGHGVGAALLSVSVINALRSQSLPDTDFKDPEHVLKSLNDFTIVEVAFG